MTFHLDDDDANVGVESERRLAASAGPRLNDRSFDLSGDNLSNDSRSDDRLRVELS
jgi:hypothetical protein